MPRSRPEHPLAFDHDDPVDPRGGPLENPPLPVELVEGEVEGAGHGGRLSAEIATRRRCNPRHNRGGGVKEAVLT